MGQPRGAPKIGGTPSDQDMLITRLPAIRFGLNRCGFEYFFKPDLSSMVSGPLKNVKLQISEPQEPFASNWTHLQAFGATRGPPGGAPKIGLLNIGIILPGGVPRDLPPRAPPGDPRGAPGDRQEIPSQFLDHRGIVEGVPGGS